MKGTWHYISYKDTGYFTPLILDYLGGNPALRAFYSHAVSAEGFRLAMAQRVARETPRALLVNHLQEQYRGVPPTAAVINNIKALNDPQTFTVCTAHQPALFTGPLYFIYKILHTIKLSEHLGQLFPDKKFVPVFWMGSEDADLDELGKCYLGTEKITWNTTQTGAVGRMHNKGIDALINRIAGELGVQPHGDALIQMLREAYLGPHNIQDGTFRFLHALFGTYGLVVLIPDSGPLKEIMIQVFEDDLFRHVAAAQVQKSIGGLAHTYKIQAQPRPVNLFYLKDNIRNRIEKVADGFRVVDTSLHFTAEQLKTELQEHPDRFSPNVILRGLFQEMLLPNIGFIGGGGEMAYWLELKNLFDHYQVPFPVLVLRNSFLLVRQGQAQKIRKLGFTISDFFQPENQLQEQYARQHATHPLRVEEELALAMRLYESLKGKAGKVDPTLEKHVEALRADAVKKIEVLQQKILRAEKRKYQVEYMRITALRNELFPFHGLQERIESFMPYYARYGKDFIDSLYAHAYALEQQFGILEEG